MGNWNEFEEAVKSKIIVLLQKTEIEESKLQIDKIMADTLKGIYLNEGVIKRKKLPDRKLLYENKKIPGKIILYRDDSKIKIKE